MAKAAAYEGVSQSSNVKTYRWDNVTSLGVGTVYATRRRPQF
jgi:hypothetical protein